MSTPTDNLPAEVQERPIDDPGLHHHWRPTDVDEKAERRAERQVAALFVTSMVGAVLFVVSYFVFDIGRNPDLVLGAWGASNMALGASLGVALLALGAGIIQWARKLMADVEIVEMRHSAGSSADDRNETLAALQSAADESGIGRRPLVRNTMLGAVAMLGLPAVVALRDLHPGKMDISVLERTVWQRGLRVVNDASGVPLRPSDIEIGALINAEPEGLVHPVGVDGHHGEDEATESGRPAEIQAYLDESSEWRHHKVLEEMAKAAVIVVRIEPKDLIETEERSNWSVDGIVCYSKICTHVGCPIALWERKTHHLLCPCHQSTFDLADSGRVVFGPAARALPQLPLMVDEEGYLVAQSDFTEPVGPSYWERG